MSLEISNYYPYMNLMNHSFRMGKTYLAEPLAYIAKSELVINKRYSSLKVQARDLPFFTEEVRLTGKTAVGTPPGFSPPLSAVICFFLCFLLFSWWAARARATVPSAVANRTLRRPGESFN